MSAAVGEDYFTLLADERSRRFLAFSLGFVSLISLSCYVEEWIFKALPGFKFPWMVAFVELLLFSLSAALQQRLQDGDWSIIQKRRAPLWLYGTFAVCLSLSQSLGKVTFLYMNYATGTIVKSGKLVPTLLLSVLWLGRPVGPAEWAAAGLLVISSSLMALGEHLSDVAFQPFGLVIAAMQLVAASMQGNVQERVLKDYDASIAEAMLFGNSLGTVLVLVGMVLNGELGPATLYFVDSPLAVVLLAIRSVTFLFGAIALNVLTKEFGTGAATAVGTARKSLTLVFSFIFFPKPYHINYVFGVVAFLAADLIYLHVASQKAAQRRLKEHDAGHRETVGGFGGVRKIGRPGEAEEGPGDVESDSRPLSLEMRAAA